MYILTLVLALTLHAAESAPPMAEAAKPVFVPPPPTPKAQALCAYFRKCVKTHPGKTAYCVKTGLKNAKFLDHVLEGDQAKDLARYLRKEGFAEREMGLKDFRQLPDGALLVLDSHDPIADKKPRCPKVYGNVLVKCDDKWVDETQENDLSFHMKAGCRSKGVWVAPELKVAEYVVEKVRRPVTDPKPSEPTR